MCNNGKTFVVSLTTIAGGTAANASDYDINFECGGANI